MEKTKTVSEINAYIKRLIQNDTSLGSVSVKGEVSNCKYHSSGHIYFTLKDGGASLGAVMFFGKRMQGLRFQLEDGQKVVVDGMVSVYEKDGRCQLYANAIYLDGVGRLYEAFQRLKEKLEAEGLFEEKYKKEIPLFPSRIGIVTASTGAAIHDIVTTVKRRNPYVELILYPAKVQGEGAGQTIVKGIKRLDLEGLDVIIIGRGGGSIEDLWCFNDEIVARAIFACKTPIISAVGHEVDYTISDFVADYRAATPTAAAEISVPDMKGTLAELAGMKESIRQGFIGKLKLCKAQLAGLEMKLMKESPASKLRELTQRVDEAEEGFRALLEKKIFLYNTGLDAMKMSLSHKIKMKYEKTSRRFMVLVEKLEGLSPLSRLTAGYSYVESERGENIRTIQKIKVNDRLKITLSDGKILAKVEEVEDGSK